MSVSVRLSQIKSAVTFEPGDGYARNFQGRPHSLQVIFGRVTRTPEYSGPGSKPEKMGFTGNLSPPRVLGRRGRVLPFWKLEDGADKMLGAEF